MAFGALGCSSVLPCCSRSVRPRPISYLGILAFFSCWGCLRPFFSLPPSHCSDGSPFGAGNDEKKDAEAQPVPTKAANNQVGAKQIHSNDNTNGDIQQLKLDMTAVQGSLASINNRLETIHSNDNTNGDIQQLKLDMRAVRGSLASIDRHLETIVNHLVTDTTENKDAVNRMKGLLGSMYSVADKLLMFCAAVFLWLLPNLSATNSSAPNSPTPNSPAPKAGQNSDDTWTHVIDVLGFILCFVIFILFPLASNFKERESIDGDLFSFWIWLLLLVYIILWPGLCLVLHFYKHTPKFVLWPLGIISLIVSVLFWYFHYYREWQKTLEERNLEAEAALAQGLGRDNSRTV